MDASEEDVLAYMAFPKEHWTQIHSTNPLERLNKEIKRRTNVVGIFPNDAAIIRLVGALLLEQNDEWALTRRYMSLESLARIVDNPVLSLPGVGKRTHHRSRDGVHELHHPMGRYPHKITEGAKGAGHEPIN
jgi:hypothetical protein